MNSLYQTRGTLGTVDHKTLLQLFYFCIIVLSFPSLSLFLSRSLSSYSVPCFLPPFHLSLRSSSLTLHFWLPLFLLWFRPSLCLPLYLLFFSAAASKGWYPEAFRGLVHLSFHSSVPRFSFSFPHFFSFGLSGSDFLNSLLSCFLLSCFLAFLAFFLSCFLAFLLSSFLAFFLSFYISSFLAY